MGIHIQELNLLKRHSSDLSEYWIHRYKERCVHIFAMMKVQLFCLLLLSTGFLPAILGNPLVEEKSLKRCSGGLIAICATGFSLCIPVCIFSFVGEKCKKCMGTMWEKCKPCFTNEAIENVEGI